MAYNTTYRRSIEYTPTEIFHGRVPHNALDLNFSKPLQTRCTKTDMTTLVAKVNQKKNASNIFEAFNKYKNYYDQKTQSNRWKKANTRFYSIPSETHNLTRPSSRRSSGMAHKKSWKYSHAPIT